MAKSKKIEVEGKAITIIFDDEQEYISLTDMLKAKDGDFFISDWLRNRNTIEYLGIWESIFNPSFNYGEFAIIKSQAGLNSYKLSVKDWTEKTNAIGLKATAGRYGGTYAHPDIAFEFGMWISPQFKIYLIKEFQRLKAEENDRLKLGWNLQRTLAKINYQIHTDAIKENLIPKEITKKQANYVYAYSFQLKHSVHPFWLFRCAQNVMCHSPQALQPMNSIIGFRKPKFQSYSAKNQTSLQVTNEVFVGAKKFQFC
jgi:hypothetical protein